MERPPNLVLDQGLEPADPAGLSRFCLVRVLLEPDELQHELLNGSDEKSSSKLSVLHFCHLAAARIS
jgi:hypothetical protein